MKTLTQLLATRLASSLAILLALFAAQSARAKDKWWTGATDNNWNTNGNWEDGTGSRDNRKFGGTESDGESKFNDLFKNTYDYTVCFTAAESTDWKVHIRSGTEEHPIVFEADNASNGLKVGNTNKDNSTGYHIGYDNSTDNQAWLKLKRGTWDTKSGGYWFVGNGSSSTGHVVVCDGATVGCSNDFKLACGSLTINGGTVTVGAWTRFEDSSCDNTINLNGGTLKTYVIKNAGGGGTKTVAFNGGTLFATAVVASDKAEGLIDSGIVAKVGATGGTINANNYNVVIAANVSDVDSSSPGVMKFCGGGNVTLGGTAGWTGGTTVEAGTVLAVTNAANVTAILGHGLTVNVPSEVSSGTVVFSTTDGTISVAQLANCAVTGTHADKFDLALGADETSIVLKNIYVWNGGTDGSKAWGEENAWLLNSDPATWSNGGIALFSTDGAQANLAADAEAAKVNFLQNATISGSGTLTVPSVSVDPSVSATISAPTAGTLTKTGAGTLTLGVLRTAQTTLTEGTLAMSGATVDGTKLTLGTDAAKPVTFDYGGQTFSADLTPALGGYDVSLTNGNFTSTVKLVVADGTLRVKKNSSVSANGHVVVGGTSDTATSTDINALLEIDGGAVTNSASNKHCIIGDYGAEGSVSRMVVKNGGSYYSRQDIVVGNRSTGYLTVDNSTVEAYGYLYFCYDAECLAGENGYVSLTNNGVLAVQKVTYLNGAGNGYFNFDGGTLKATANNQTLLEKKDRLFVNVNAAGGTIDNNGKTITINADLLGEGDMTFVGSGKTTIGGSQTGAGAINCDATETIINAGLSVARPVTVKADKKLTINATAQATVNTLTLEAGSTLNIASYTGSVTPLAVTTLALPDSGMASLRLNGGAFSDGIYKILEQSGIVVADVGEKLVPYTGGKSYSYSVSGSILVLTVGTPAHGRWIASADGDFNEPGNWSDNQVPVASDSLDFRGVTSGITINCGDLSATSFAGVTLPTNKVQVTINGTLRLASMSVVADSRNFSVASGSKLIVDGNVTLNSEENKGIRYIVYENYGDVEIGGKVITSGKPMGYPCYNCSNSATITVKGIVSGSSGDHFKLNAFSENSSGVARLIVGSDGLSNISGKKEFWIDHNIGKGAELKAAEDFAIDSNIGAKRKLTLDTNDGKKITINGEICKQPDAGKYNTLTVKGSGTVLCNYEQKQSEIFNGDVVVTNTATLAINAGKRVTTGTIVVNTNATLQVAQSAASAEEAAVTLGGDLTLKAGAALGFNYTTRNEPKLDLTGKTVTFDEGAATNVVVKISSDDGVWPSSGQKVLTSGGNFKGVNVDLDSNKPRWAKLVGVNEEGNIYVEVKPKGLMIMVY